MNPAALLALAAAAIGYGRPRAKRKKLPSALLWGAGGYLLATQGLPRLGISLPALNIGR